MSSWRLLKICLQMCVSPMKLVLITGTVCSACFRSFGISDNRLFDVQPYWIFAMITKRREEISGSLVAEFLLKSESSLFRKILSFSKQCKTRLKRWPPKGIWWDSKSLIWNLWQIRKDWSLTKPSRLWNNHFQHFFAFQRNLYDQSYYSAAFCPNRRLLDHARRLIFWLISILNNKCIKPRWKRKKNHHNIYLKSF